MRRTILAAGAALLAATALAGAAAGDEPKSTAKSVPASPLTLAITGTAEYDFDPTPLTPEAHKKVIESAAKKGKDIAFGAKLPPAPAVDLAVVLKNTSARPVTVWVKGDPVMLTLDLTGKGAFNLDPPIAMTQEFRIPQELTLDAGKSYTFSVKQLKSGARGMTHFSYWTGPGAYELTATLRTGVQPAPKGAEVNDGFGVVTLTSAPFALAVVDKK